ncbi:SDR family NAD(P)-dependent oxidoreductase [Lolliginicoccus suaedae]|uniref:SDR family NAD(P)-dependent oxidoreductase n=1 Tax=Lolliginicoccus suaedae TaxID=2605429 RepID=UPI001F24705C|nr:SDR family NAD(P)-dependent oxidoreductase [Lolliginicoccus suaedae]
MTPSFVPRGARMLARTADAVLEGTVVGSFSSLGLSARRALPEWPGDPELHALRDKTVLVTGAGSGIGAECARQLAMLGARVLLGVRTPSKGTETASWIRGSVPGADVDIVDIDVADLSSVRRAARHVLSVEPRLDVVIHNAGVLPKERELTTDGHEVTLATHVLGPLLLSELLRPALRASGTSRVVFVSSGGMYTQGLAVDDPEYAQGEYKGAVAYARTKRMQVSLVPLLAHRWAVDGIAVHAMHPGWANTPGVVDALPGFHRLMRPLLRDARAGADTIVWLAAAAPAPESGHFWHDRHQRSPFRLPGTKHDEHDVMRLWEFCRGVLDLPVR